MVAERFEFTDKIKKPLFIMMILGVVGLALAAFLYPENKMSRMWSNILLNTYFFTGIGIFGVFFVAANQLGYSGWIALVKRIILALSGFVKVAAVFALIIIGGVFLGYHNLYEHWSDAHHREGLDIVKQQFFQPMFWAARIIIYYLLWITVGTWSVNYFNRDDINDKRVYKMSKLIAALWIVIFAVTESFVSWDMVMSQDPHWYSTLFGWYNFASYACAGFAFSILFTLFLKSKGYLKLVNENHIHDLGKYMFAFSVFWTYLWFSQFMLQWYGNIPEDTIYWIKRFDVPLFKVTIFLSLFTCFIMPFLILLKRGSKRNFRLLGFVAVVVILGHWVDFFNLTHFEPNVPQCATHGHHAMAKDKINTAIYAENHGQEAAATATHTDAATTEAHATASHEAAASHGHGDGHHCPSTYAGIGIVEILIFIGFLGGFIFMFFHQLAKFDLYPVNDPYIKESIRHHVEYA